MAVGIGIVRGLIPARRPPIDDRPYNGQDNDEPKDDDWPAAPALVAVCLVFGLGRVWAQTDLFQDRRDPSGPASCPRGWAGVVSPVLLLACHLLGCHRRSRPPRSLLRVSPSDIYIPERMPLTLMRPFGSTGAIPVAAQRFHECAHDGQALWLSGYSPGKRSARNIVPWTRV